MNLPLNIDIQQILLHIFNFLILFGGLYFILYSPVKKFMDKREQEYRKNDEKSEKLRHDAEELKREYEDKMSELEHNTKAIKQRAEDEARKSAEAIVSKANADAEAIVEKAKDSAQKKKAEIIRSADKDIAVLCEAALEKIITDSANEDYDSFIKSAKETVKNGK